MPNSALDGLPLLDGASIADNDQLYIHDESEAGILKSKRTRVSDVLAKTKVYTDTLYQPLGIVPSSSVFIKPQEYGAIGDGSSHPLSSIYPNLAAAQVVYPFATSLTQEVDYCAFKKMCLDALGAEGFEHADVNAHLNKPMWIPAGNYLFGNDTLTIRNTSGMKMWGSGKRATKIYGNNTIIAFDGLWYSDMRDMSIICQTTTATVAFDIDGNVPGHPYATRGVQGNNFENMLVDGGFSSYCVAMCRLGSSGGQGSENTFKNVHFERANLACYYQLGFNALNNTFIGGNFQSYNKNGIQLDTGHINVFSVGFQSTTGYNQIVNDGWDISLQGSGVTDKIFIAGCRTESLRFCKALGSTPPSLSTITHNPSQFVWGAGAIVTTAAGYFVIRTAPNGQKKMYRVSTEGVLGGSEPVWPNSGTVADGTAVWTQTDYRYIELEVGSIDFETCKSPVEGPIYLNTNPRHIEVNTDYTVKPWEKIILVDASTGVKTITIPSEVINDFSPVGDEIIIKKYDNSANKVEVTSAGGFIDFDFADAAADIPGGSRGYVRLMKMGGGSLTRRWMIVGKG